MEGIRVYDMKDVLCPTYQDYGMNEWCMLSFNKYSPKLGTGAPGNSNYGVFLLTGLAFHLGERNGIQVNTCINQTSR